jgi:hypothetical protein
MCCLFLSHCQPSGAEGGEVFGYSVSGDYAIAGAYKDTDNGNWSGPAYIFKEAGPKWTQQTKFFKTCQDEVGRGTYFIFLKMWITI